MISNNEAWDEFISDHRWAVLTVLRRSGQPNSSVVAYVRDGDELLVSTPGTTFKRQAIDADPRVNLTIISDAHPFNFVAVEAEAQVTTDNLFDDTRLLFQNIADAGYPEPDDLQAWLEHGQRVVLRIKPHGVHGVIR